MQANGHVGSSRVTHRREAMDTGIVQQQQLRESINEEIARRTRIHQRNIARAKTAIAYRARIAAKAIPRPLALLAHGDSWFDYPLDGNTPSPFRTDIEAHLEEMGNPTPYIYNISHYGDATTDEMSWPKQERMIEALQDEANWFDGKPDGILISGGGNDIAGDQFCILLNYDGTLNTARLKEVLSMVHASYNDLFAFRDAYAPGVPIFANCYDFAIPNNRGTFCAGPWLWPSLSFCGCPTLAAGTAIVRQVLLEFKNLLTSLAKPHDFILVDTQGTLVASDWANELHPYPTGFENLAVKFVAALQHEFPGRI
jgi:hypothetical protein